MLAQFAKRMDSKENRPLEVVSINQIQTFYINVTGVGMFIDTEFQHVVLEKYARCFSAAIKITKIMHNLEVIDAL